MKKIERVLIVGAAEGSHIGGSLLHGAATLGIEAQLCDTAAAWPRERLLQKILWRYGGKRPLGGRAFEKRLLESVHSFHPQLLIATGMAPLRARTLRRLHSLGIRCVNLSTDDPFNPQHRASWFLEALREYDVIFSPRRANEEELRAHGCRSIVDLPFGYDPRLFYPVSGEPGDESDLLFAGVGDRDRLPYIAAALESGIRVRLHGIDWDRFPETAKITSGQADIATLRRAIASCRVALCLVRRSNRDGHSMRTFEVPAVGACMVVEDTRDHRDVFGPEGETVCYFQTPGAMVAKVRQLLDDEPRRLRLRDDVHRRVVNGGNTYADRLRAIVAAAEVGELSL